MWANYDAAALTKDRAIFPVRKFNAKNEPNWKGSEADAWLRMDMQEEKHLSMKPQELRKTRERYQLFSKKRFSKRIDQIKESQKEFGTTPGQHKSKRLGDPKLSLLLGKELVLDEAENSTHEEAKNEGS